MHWNPIETAPMGGVVLLAVAAFENANERRTFVAEMSHEESGSHWVITTGWTGWVRLHGAWEPIGWQSLPEAPAIHESPCEHEVVQTCIACGAVRAGAGVNDAGECIYEVVPGR